jgi:hypothetical protein
MGGQDPASYDHGAVMERVASVRTSAINEDWDQPVFSHQPSLRDGAPTRAAPPTAAGAPAVAEKARVSRSADRRRPYHVGVAIGISAGLYAASLGAVTTLQIATDQQLIEDRQPVSTAIDVLGRHHEDLSQRLAAARDSYTAANHQFSSLAGDMKALHDRLVALRGQLAALDRTKVPGSLSLPTLPTIRGGGSVRAPAAPAAAPAPPPPTHAKSGASGGH